jgi:drug/metabolite transporter (DMT)-like permease
MNVAKPHWLTSTIAVTGVVCALLASNNTFPKATALFAALAGLCAVCAAPTLTSKPEVKP